MKNKWILFTLLISTVAHASASRTIDAQFITNGANTLTIPGATDTLVGKATTDILTNKTLTAPTITAPSITGATSLTDALSIVNASVASKVLQFSLSGMSSSTTLTLTSSQSTSQSLAIPNVSSGDTFATRNATQTFGAGSTWNGVKIGTLYGGTNIDGSAAANGTLLIGNGSGYSLSTLTAGTNVSITNGAGSITINATSPAPSLNGGSGSAESVTAGGGVTLTSITYSNFAWVVGSGGAVTVTATPSVTAGTADGQLLRIVGTSNTNTVTLQDQANLASSGLSLNGNWVAAKDSTITLHWDATQSLWVEDSRR